MDLFTLYEKDDALSWDIRLFLETRRGGGWAPLWPPTPDPERWWALLADRLVEGGADPVAAEAALRRLSPEEVEARYGRDPDLLRAWPLPADAGDLGPVPLLRVRDAAWFAAISSLDEGEGGPAPVFASRGLPGDLSAAVAAEAAGDADAVDHSWLGVAEVLGRPELAGFRQAAWLRRHVPDPAGTRVVFWFS